MSYHTRARTLQNHIEEAFRFATKSADDAFRFSLRSTLVEDLPEAVDTLDLDGLNSRSQNLFCCYFEQAMDVRPLNQGDTHPWDGYRKLVKYTTSMGLRWKDFVICIDLETTRLRTLSDISLR
ncbi:hypothetical protein BT69DRAFT_1342990 [Atractiella rhizophila]|nr:hypothetical protein BT69DRAFT_1342990 [Atractiella rhizophila]